TAPAGTCTSGPAIACHSGCSPAGISPLRWSASRRAPSTSSPRASEARRGPAARRTAFRSSSAWPRRRPTATGRGRSTHARGARGAGAAAGATFSELAGAGYRRDKAFVARLCVRAVDRLFEGGGARAIVEPDPLQRVHRDAHGASHHLALSWDVTAEAYGRE